MRLDFAEERRWKRVLAREYAYQVVEWHLSSPRDKASLMVGGIGWGARRHTPVTEPAPPLKSKANENPQDTGDLAEEADTAKETAENSLEVEEENTGGQVLDEIMPRRATRGKGKLKRRLDEEKETTPEPEPKPSATDDIDVQMTGNAGETPAAPVAEPGSPTEPPPAAAGKSDAKATTDTEDVDADGEADAEGEVDAQGEDDGESADVVDGVIGLSGESNKFLPIIADCRYPRR